MKDINLGILRKCLFHKQSWLSLYFVIVLCTMSYGQSTVTGHLANEREEPLIGATVLWKGDETVNTVTDEKGDFVMKIKKQGKIYEMLYPTHPFDVIGWDGYNFPYGFSIHNFEPITGRIHQPPPVHQTFETTSFVVCSFCPRLYDYHPRAIPAPYNHSNIDSDEVIYYVDGDFMSRNNIEQGHITLHPGGIPHGPAPGTYERSIGKKETIELAVMIDTFRPLMVTEEALKIDDGKYYKSWLD